MKEGFSSTSQGPPPSGRHGAPQVPRSSTAHPTLTSGLKTLLSPFSHDPRADKDSDDSDRSDISIPTLKGHYDRIVHEWEQLVEAVSKVLVENKDDNNKNDTIPALRRGKRFFDNTLSMFISWGCDIRIDSGTLEKIQDSTITLSIRATFEDIEFHLAQMRHEEWSTVRECCLAFDQLSPAFQKDMVDLIFRLQDQVKPIRVYLAVETKSGPLNGLATQIEETAKLPNPDDIAPSKTESVSSNADPMPSHVRALQGHENMWRPVHTSTLAMLNNLGSLYAGEGKMAEAEAMYVRALQGKEKVSHKPDRRKVENKESEITSIREDLEKAKSYPEGSNRTRDLTFITLRNLRKVIDRDRLRKLLQEFRWYKDALLEHIYTQFLRIVGILITVEWPDWESFPTIFLEPLDSFGQPSRRDIHLPFIDAHFLTHTTSQRLFEWDQYIFCPITIKENSHDVIGRKRRLPFLSSSSIGGGGSGTVSKVQIEKYQILFTAGQAGGESNTKTKWMARKVIISDARGSRSYQTERRNLDLFKKGVTDCDVILKNFASFVHGSSLNIIYPLADLDLHTFLKGNYTTFQNRAVAFKPRHMLGQIRSLASALQFLHAELYIDGQMSECAHLDLKPDNILVFWRDDGGTDECAGQWKITDFGISVVRSREPGSGQTERRTDQQRLAPGDIAREISSRERSSMQAPRGPGPWQPPEMQEGRVTKSSDLWSFGCILATVLAFTLGGPEKVSELYLCRKREGQYENDYFYTDGPVVKSEVLQWLDAQVDAHSPAQKQWIKLSQGLIVELLSIDKNLRPSAQKARNRASEILQMTESEASLWKSPRNRLPQKPSSAPASDSESIASFGMGASQELPEKSLESGGPNPDVPLRSKPERGAHSGMLPADNTRKVVSQHRRGRLSGAGGVAMASEESTTAGTAPQADTGLEPTTTRIRTSVSWPAPAEATTYARLETPPKTTQVRLSPDGQIAAFLSKARVFVYCLTDISLLQQPWPQSLSQAEMISQNSDQNSFKEFTPSNGRQWTSVLVAGPFVALCSVPSKNPDSVHGKVEIHASRGASQAPREVDIPDTCGDIRLSAQGALLLISDNHLDLHFSDGTQDQVSLLPSCQAQTATFTDNGDWLCVWYTTASWQYWCIWDMKTQPPTRKSLQKRRLPEPPPRSLDFHKQLIAFCDKPWFAACDQYGNACLVRPKRDPGILPPEPFGITCDGAVAGASIPDGQGVIFVRRPDGTLNLRAEVARVVDVPAESGVQLKPWVRLDRPFDGETCGLSVCNTGNGVYFLTCHRDGILVRKRYSDAG